MSKQRNRDFSRKVQVGKYLFNFVEAEESVYCRAYKNGMQPVLIMLINVTDAEGTIVAEYERIWKSDSQLAHVYDFIDKFLRDSKYRKQFQIYGEPVLVEQPITEDLIKPSCAKAIQRINASKPGMLKFRDFATLKTYGRDKVSSMKLDVLKDIVTGDEMDRIKANVAENDVVAVLRWMKRGLQIDHAIHKVKVDREIANNARG